MAWWPTEWSWRSLALVVAAALLPGAGAYAAYSIMQRELGAARVGVVMYLGPLYSARAGVGWCSASASKAFTSSARCLILPGIFLSTRR